ncbi:stage III sporulation protein AG [Lederbergia lenta]|nr:stage III sporulation protein AG [Lederbergia lenta]MCM3111471.1 stage III sporulation protein AG [Lederbergia lenta]MEC2325142.1 stage III sporulation protein AG [Lederbergia lenta]
MDNKNGPLDWIKDKLGENTTGKKPGKHYYLLIVLLIGAAFMLMGNIWGKNPVSTPVTALNEEPSDDSSTEVFKQKETGKNNGMKIYEDQYENQLKEALEQIVGVHSVTVVVNVDSTESQVYEKNSTLKNQTTSEEDDKGGKRQVEDQSHDEQLVTIREGEKEVPLISETRKPNIKGVLVVAGGAENIQVKSWIIEAVTRSLDVPSHKVAVMPKKSKGDS